MVTIDESRTFIKPSITSYLYARFFNTTILSWILLTVAVVSFLLIIFYPWSTLSFWSAATTALISAMALFSGCVIAMGIVIAVRSEFGAYTNCLFMTKSQGNRLFAEARAHILKLGGRAAVASLHTAMNELKTQYQAQDMRTRKPTRSGYDFKERRKLPSDDNEAFNIIIEETLHLWLCDIDDGGFSKTSEDWTGLSYSKFPQKAQDYILQFFPALVSVNPLRFDDIHLNVAKNGFSHVVNTFLALSMSQDEVIEEARAWLNQEIPRTTDSSVGLPADLAV